MKKKNIQLKLNLKKQTVTELHSVKGGIEENLKTREIVCVSNTPKCNETRQPTPCCPGCRSGFNATLAMELCVVEQSLAARDNTTC